jgi:RNA polymerase sigma-70 factor (ECF subfamily)
MDERIYERARSGDRKAVDELFEAYAGSAAKMARQIAGARQDLEDIVQEALLKAFRSIGSFRWDSSFPTWLYRIIANVCCDFARKSAATQCVSLDAMHDAEDDEGVARALGASRAVASSAVALPEEEAIRSEEREAIERAVAALPYLDRAVFVMREIGSLSYKDIADALGCSIESVRSRLARARRQVRINIGVFLPGVVRS